MNPSSSGWINKHQPVINRFLNAQKIDASEFYELALRSGFLYGVSVTSITYGKKEPLKWTEIERTKLNLFDCLYYTYFHNQRDESDFYTEVCAFYEQINPKHTSYFSSFSKNKPGAATLEKIIQERVQTNEARFERNFSNLITNALLFLDVIAFEQYLKNKSELKNYAAALEAGLMNIIWIALMQKEEKEQYDYLLLKLFEKSLRYTKAINQEAQSLDDLSLAPFQTLFEKRYALDLGALALWDDHKLDKTEFLFLNRLGNLLQLPEEVLKVSTTHVLDFIHSNHDRISYLNYSNPVRHFYTQTSDTVKRLIIRNKKRLLQELLESKDLVMLLGQSTYRDLNKAEKKQVKAQLLDICKSIPSLAIFMLPGGGVLLPLLIKFIPELLPSAFNDNRIDPSTEDNS